MPYIPLLSSYDFGGAATACLRLFAGLQQRKDLRTALFVKKKLRFPSPLPSIHAIAEPEVPLSLSALWKEKRTRKVQKKQELEQFKSEVKKALPSSYDNFNLAFTNHRLGTQTNLQEADVLNVHWVAEWLDYPSFFKSFGHKPIVWTLHDMEAFSSGLSYSTGSPFSEEEITQALSKNAPEIIQKASQKNYKIKEKALASVQNLHIVSPSRWLMEASAKSPLFKRFPHHHIPYGIKGFQNYPKAACRAVWGIAPERPTLLFLAVGVGSPRKGFDLLEKALEHPDLQGVQLLVIGQKPQSDSPLYAREGVQFTGFITDEKLLNLAYCAADAFVLPSRQDNLPNTMLEALCSGTPVVSFAVGGMLDVIKDGENGYLCPPFDTDALAKSLKKAIEKRWDNPQIAQIHQEKFAQEKQAEAYMQLFKSIL